MMVGAFVLPDGLSGMIDAQPQPTTAQRADQPAQTGEPVRGHRGAENLAGILISRLDDGTNARTLASMLLADPRDLGLAPDAVQERLRSRFRPDRLWYLPLQSGALEALSDGFPEDDLVRT